MTMNLNELVRGGTLCMSKAGLAVGADGKTFKTAAPNGAGTDFAINGIAYHKTDADNIAMTAADEQAENTRCIYLVTLNSSGTAATVKGTEVLTTDLAAGTDVLNWPEPAADTCPIGAIKVVTTGVTFTAGTTSFVAGVSGVYYDLLAVPVAPLTS